MNEICIMRSTNESIDELIKLISLCYEKKNAPLSMIEIGSYKGESLEIFVKTKKVKSIICIDPWQQGYDENDAASNTDMKIVESLFDEKVKELSDKNVSITKYKGVIDGFVKDINFENIDLVYIDGNHIYNACKHDIEMVMKFIKPTIAIAGHDYTWWPDVKRAVDEMFGKPDKTFSASSWIKFL